MPSCLAQLLKTSTLQFSWDQVLLIMSYYEILWVSKMGIMMSTSESFENLLKYNIGRGQFVEFKVLETPGFVFK